VLNTIMLLGGASSLAQTDTTSIAVVTTVLQPAVKRFGINLGQQTYYDSGQMTKNLVFQNPGFESTIYQSTIRCASGTATTCVDDDVYAQWPDGFWKGATIEIFFGNAKGRKETVTSYTGVHGSALGTFTFAASGAVPAVGDYMIVRMPNITGNGTSGWGVGTTGGGTITTNLTDMPPGTTGRQTASLRAPGASDSAVLAAYFDSTKGKTFVALNGAFQLSFKAKGVGGTNSLRLTLVRTGLPSYISQTVQLSGSWQTYTFPFNATETGSVAGTVTLNFGTVGADAVLLDDVSLVQTDSDTANPTVFRDAVVNTLETLNPGILRFWAEQLGDTLDNLIVDPFGRQRTQFRASNSQLADVSYGLPEFLQLCETIGAEPWFVVPITFSTTDAAHLIEYLAGATTTPYGAKRAAGGHPGSLAMKPGTVHSRAARSSIRHRMDSAHRPFLPPCAPIPPMRLPLLIWC
jgi:hypothetical protein